MAMRMMISSLAVYMLSVSNHRIEGSPRLFRGEASASCSGKLLGTLFRIGRCVFTQPSPGTDIRFRQPAILFARVRSNQGSQCTIDLIKIFICLENIRSLPPETMVVKVIPGRGAAYIQRSRRFKMNRHETRS
jgi:hypothetical protein